MGGLGVGIVYSHAMERFLARHVGTVDFIAIDPKFLASAPSDTAPQSLTSLHARVAALDLLADRYPLVAHGAYDVEPVAHWHGRYDFRWVGVRLAPDLEVSAAAEAITLRIARMQRKLGCRLLLAGDVRQLAGEGRALVETLCRSNGCGVQLDLHELHVHAALCGREPEDMLTAPELEHVTEIHIGGPVSAARWRLLASLLPRCPQVRGVVLSAGDRELARMGDDGFAAELARARASWQRHRCGVPKPAAGRASM
jgi:hypothetical protein